MSDMKKLSQEPIVGHRSAHIRPFDAESAPDTNDWADRPRRRGARRLLLLVLGVSAVVTLIFRHCRALLEAHDERLTFNADGTFRICMFEDLHFGESPSSIAFSRRDADQPQMPGNNGVHNKTSTRSRS